MSSLEFNAPFSREVGTGAPDALAQALRQGLSVGADAQLSTVPPYPSLIGNLGLIMTRTAVVLAIAVGCTMLRNPDGVGSPLRTHPLGKREGFPLKDEAAKEVSQRLVAIQESVRRDMADYLHGHVQSKLVALSASLGMCQQILGRDPLAASGTLERIKLELQKLQDEDVRRVSRELYPSIIKLGLVPAIRNLVSRFADLIDIDLTFDPSGP